jgi:hypothetical protein
MTVLKELTVALSKYTDKSGKEKTQWLKIGEIHESKEGKHYGVIYPHINLAALPKKDGDNRVFFNMFDPKPYEGKGTAPSPDAAPSADFNDDIPF